MDFLIDHFRRKMQIESTVLRRSSFVEGCTVVMHATIRLLITSTCTTKKSSTLINAFYLYVHSYLLSREIIKNSHWPEHRMQAHVGGLVGRDGLLQRVAHRPPPRRGRVQLAEVRRDLHVVHIAREQLGEELVSTGAERRYPRMFSTWRVGAVCANGGEG